MHWVLLRLLSHASSEDTFLGPGGNAGRQSPERLTGVYSFALGSPGPSRSSDRSPPLSLLELRPTTRHLPALPETAGTSKLLLLQGWTSGRMEKSRMWGCVQARSPQSCLTLWDPMDCGPPGSSVHGILQIRTLECVAMPSSRGSSRPRGRTCISSVSCIGMRLLYHQHHLGRSWWWGGGTRGNLPRGPWGSLPL